MYCNILTFLEEHSIIFNRQFSFRQKHSTSHAIITLIHKITNSLDHGDIVISIFLDLKIAFDTVYVALWCCTACKCVLSFMTFMRN